MKRIGRCLLLLFVFLGPASHAFADELGSFLEAQGYHAVQMKKNIINHFEITATINGVESSFIVDTGASGTVFDLAQAQAIGLPNLGPAGPATGPGGDVQAYLSKVGEFNLGNLSFTDYTVLLIDLSSVNNAYQQLGLTEKLGVIGGDILSTGKAVIDYSNATLYLMDLSLLSGLPPKSSRINSL